MRIEIRTCGGVGRSNVSRGLIPKVAVVLLAAVAPGFGQRVGARQITAQAVRFGPLVPGKSGASMSQVLPVSLTIPSAMAARGFVVNAFSNFNFTPTAPAAGGKTMTASDIGIGIIDVSWAPGMSGNTTIAAGFGYDPAVNGNHGFSPLGDSNGARATLADVLSPREVVRVEKIPVKVAPNAAAELRLTLKLAARGQYLTPGTFSGTLTLIVPD